MSTGKETKMMPFLEHVRAYRCHRQKLEEAKSMTDNSTPKQRAHLDLRLKQLQMQEDRQAIIDRDNRLLLKRMTEILKDSSNPSKRSKKDKDFEGKSLNAPFRDRERMRIEMENLAIARRIERTRPVYRVDRWESDYRKQKRLVESWKKHHAKSRIYALPEDSYDVKGKGSDTEDEYRSDFDSDSGHEEGEETDRENRRGDKLPPIKAGQKGNDTRRSRAESPEPHDKDKEGAENSKERSQRRWEYVGPDPNLWMYYGIPPSYSDDEDGESSPRGKKKSSEEENKEKDKEKDKAEHQAETDAKQLFKVAKKMGPPQDIIIRTLAKKSFNQRMKTKDKFNELYELDLETELKKGLGPKWALLIESLLAEQTEGSSSTSGVIKSLKTGDPVALVKKLTPLTNQDISEVKEEYYKEHSSYLESDISRKYQPPTETLLLTLVKGTKRERDGVNDKVAEKDAKALYEFGTGRWTADNGKFMRMLEDRTPAHMNSVFVYYKGYNNRKPVSKSIQEECSKEYAQCVNAYVSATETAGFETADHLHKNLDPTNPVFVRTVVARSETDIDKVRKEYKKKYGTEMVEDLEKKSDHTTVPVLRALIERNPSPKTQEKKPGKSEKAQKEDGKPDGSNPDDDAQKLHDAMQGVGTKEDVIVEIIPARTNEQRQQIKTKYQKNFKKDLIKDLKSELSGDFSDVILGLMMPPLDYDVHCLKKATDGLGTDETTLVGILCSKDEAQMADVKRAYKAKYKTDLVTDVKNDTSGDFKDLLLKLISNEDKKGKVDKAKAEEDARILEESPSDDAFTEVFIISSNSQLNATAAAYKKLYKKDISVAIKKNTSGDLRDGYMARVKAQKDMPSFYAGRLNSSMKGMGTNEGQLTRILIATSETELPAISSKYEELYGNPLDKDVESETSGDYKKALLQLIKSHSKETKGKKGRNDGRAPQRREPQAQNKGATTGVTPRPRSRERDPARQGKGKSSSQERSPKERKVEREKEREGQTRREETKKRETGEKSGETGQKGKEAGGQKGKEGGQRDKEAGQKDKEAGQKDKEAGQKKKEEEDAVRLYNAMNGLGTDENVLVDIIPSRTNAQRQQIKDRYQELYQKDLEADLKSELSGDLSEVILALMAPADQYDALALEEAMKGGGADETELIGIVCSKTPGELKALKDSYKKSTNKDLAEVIGKETKGNFKEVILQVLRGERDTSTKVDKEKADRDAEDIGKNQSLSAIKELYSKASSAQIKATEDAHMKLYNKDIRESIKDASSGDEEELYLALANSQGDPADFYVGRFHRSMKGFGTNDTQLIRLLVSRSEVDLADIKSKYQKRFGSTLREDVDKETSGDYNKVLLKIIDGASGGKRDAKKDKGGDSKGKKDAQKNDSPRKPKEALPTKETKKEALLKTVKDAASGKNDPRRQDEQAKKDAGGKNREQTTRAKGKQEKIEEAVQGAKQGGAAKKEAGKKGKQSDQSQESNDTEDATRLYQAMEGFGTDEDVIVDILPQRSNAQRQQIKARFKELYNKDLEESLQSELGGDLKDAVLGLMMPPVEYDAHCLHEAMCGPGTDEEALIGVICSKTPPEMAEIRKVYKTKYKTELDADIGKETKGEFGRLITALAAGLKPSNGVDEAKAEADAREIHDEPTEKCFNRVFTENSRAQMTATAEAHQRLFGKDIAVSLKRSSSDDAETAYLALVEAFKDESEFYAKRLSKAMKGFGTNDTQLIRILVSRSEIDLPAIKSKYQALYGRPLRKDVESETGGAYEKLLLKLLDGADGLAKKSKDDKNKDKRAQTPKTPGNGKRAGVAAIKLFNCIESSDKEGIVNIVTGQSNAERQKTKAKYQELYKKDLVTDLKKELGGDLEETILALMMPPLEYEAHCMHQALAGLGTDDTILIGMLTAKKQPEMDDLKQTYKKLYDKALEEDIKKDTSGDYRDILLQLLAAQRDQATKVDKDKADQDAKTIHDDPTTSNFQQVFIKSSRNHVKAVVEAYQKLFGEDITESIGRVTMGDTTATYTSIVKSCSDEMGFYAERLHKAIYGLGTNDTLVIRLIVSKAETDLSNIKVKYQNLYNTSLRGAVEKNVSGHYKTALLKLLDK